MPSEPIRGEIGELAGGLEYPAVHAAIARFQKRLKTDRELQQTLFDIVQKGVSKALVPASLRMAGQSSGLRPIGSRG